MEDLEVFDRLGEDLRTAGYGATAVPELLGTSAHRALGRGELWPALRATRDGSPLATLVRLFLLGTSEPAATVARALPTTGLAAAPESGALESDGLGALTVLPTIRVAVSRGLLDPAEDRQPVAGREP